jgi:circadian clock protein KaiB
MGEENKEQFILYVSGLAPNSLRALVNAKQICSEISETAELEIVDVYRQPELVHNIVATPTLVRIKNGEVSQVVGNISDKRRVISLLHSS